MYIPQPTPYSDQESHLGNSSWGVPRLIALSADLPTISVPLDALNLAQTVYTCTMRQLVTEIVAIQNADLSYPILLSEDGEIFDGRHRIMKALSLGHSHIDAKRFNTNPKPDKEHI
jgi:hypothetical protein